MTDGPFYVRLEYWRNATWEIGHHGTRLVNPTKYLQALAKRGTIARAVDLDTGETTYVDGGDLL